MSTSTTALAAALALTTCCTHGAQAFVPLVPAFLSVLSCGSRRVGRIVALNRDGVGLQRIPPAVANGVSIRARRKEHDHQAVNDHLPNGTHERTLLSRGDFGRLGLAMIGASTVVDWVSQQSARADGETAVAGNGGDVSGAAMPAAAVAESRAVVPAPAREAVPLRDMGLEVSYTGKSLPLNKFLGSKATLVVNPKLDDPESLHQMPGITKLATKYANEGLNVLLFPTEQGTFEADEDRVVRIKFYQFYGFGQYPRAVVFDKVDIVGTTIHPFYRYLCRSLKNPNGVARITLNYEKFLLDKDGKVVRRYPRKLEAEDFEQDVQALVADKPLPTESRDYKLSWLKADQEALKSEYAFKLGLNYYNNPPNMAF